MKSFAIALALLLVFAVPVLAQDPTPTAAPNPVLTFIRDQSWQFWGVVVTIVGLAITVVVERRRKPEKSLLCLVRMESLDDLGRTSRAAGEISGRSKIRVVNNGKREVVATDFVSPICFSFGSGCQVLKVISNTASVAAPDTIRVSQDKKAICIEPQLINPNEAIDITVFVTPFPKNPLVSGRIVGVPPLKIIKRIPFFTRTESIMIICAISVILMNGYTTFSSPNGSTKVFVFASIAIVLFTVLPGVIRYWFDWKR